MKNFKILTLLFLATLLAPQAHALIIGSNVATSRQPRALFPSTDTNNTMKGFASFVEGFNVQTNTTTVTWNDFYPLSGICNLRGGQLVLRQDLKFSNIAAWVQGGFIQGNNYSIEFEKRDNPFVLPSGSTPGVCVGDLNPVAQVTMGAGAHSLDWDYTGSYLAVGALASTGNLGLFYFNQTSLTLTSTASITTGGEVNDLHWNPSTQPYLVSVSSIASNNVTVYEWKSWDGSLVAVNNATAGTTAATSCRWHPSGKYLAVTGTGYGIAIYSFTVTSLFVPPTLTLLGSPTTVTGTLGNTDIIKWSPNGHYLAVGVTGQGLLVYFFNGSTLTLAASLSIPQTIYSIAWHPTLPYIVMGFPTYTPYLQLFSFTESTSALVSIPQRANTGATVCNMGWCPKGQSLVLATANGSTGQGQIYTFNSVTQTFTLFDYVTWSGGNGNLARYPKRSGKYPAFAVLDDNAYVYSLDGLGGSGVNSTPFVFNNTTLVFNDETTIAAPCRFQGTCKIDARGNQISFQSLGSVIVRPGGSLTIQNALLTNINPARLYCMADSCNLTLRNCALALSNNFTFSTGAILFDLDVIVTGTNTFTYGAARTSTIASNARLWFEQGTTFSYDPRIAKKTLLYLPDSSAQLYLSGATLFSTRTGLNLSSGTLILDNLVTISNQARVHSEAVIISPNVNTNVLGCATVNMYGLFADS